MLARNNFPLNFFFFYQLPDKVVQQSTILFANQLKASLTSGNAHNLKFDKIGGRGKNPRKCIFLTLLKTLAIFAGGLIHCKTQVSRNFPPTHAVKVVIAFLFYFSPQHKDESEIPLRKTDALLQHQNTSRFSI